jgi:Tfp pilus assembly protein PilN
MNLTLTRGPRTQVAAGQPVPGTPPLPAVNLLPASVAERVALRRLQRRLALGLAAVAAGLVLGLAMVSAERGAAENGLQEARAEQDALTGRLGEFSELLDTKAEIGRTRDALTAAMGYEVEWVQLVRQIEGVLPAGAAIRSIAMMGPSPLQAAGAPADPTGHAGIGSIAFTVAVPSLPGAAEWLDALGGIPGFMDASYSSVSQANAASGGESGRYLLTSTVQLNIGALSGDFIDLADAAPDAAPESGEPAEGEGR